MRIQTTAMFLAPAFVVAIFFDATTAVVGDQCPPGHDIQPCTCEVNEFGYGMEYICRNTQLGWLQNVLANVSLGNQSISSLELDRIELSNLPQTLLAGLGITILRIWRCNLSSVDDDAFAGVADKLRSLQLSNNALEHVPSPALAGLSSLRFLWLDNNRIKTLHAEAFKGLHSLEHISLGKNKIASVHDSAFLGIGNQFTSLYIDENELTAVPSQALRHVGGSIQSLHMYGNKIAALYPEEFVAMGGQSLNYLTLASNRIRHLPPRAFLSLRSLECVLLSGNGIETVHPLAFEGLGDSFRRLNLGHNRLNEIPAVSMKNMSRVWSLVLTRNNISTIRKDDFQPFAKNLEALYLNLNPLKTVDPTTFTDMGSLRSLNLNDNELNSAPYDTYAPVLDRLKYFNIYDNPFHCDCQIAWLSDWMKGNGSSIVSRQRDVRCSTPEAFAGIPIKDVERHLFVCPNSSNITSR